MEGCILVHKNLVNWTENYLKERPMRAIIRDKVFSHSVNWQVGNLREDIFTVTFFTWIEQIYERYDCYCSSPSRIIVNWGHSIRVGSIPGITWCVSIQRTAFKTSFDTVTSPNHCQGPVACKWSGKPNSPESQRKLVLIAPPHVVHRSHSGPFKN